MLKEGVSIVTCTYNGAMRIEETLRHLAGQVLNDINCEIIVVDNNSSDDTGNIAKEAWKKIGNTKINFRIVCEYTPGVAYARRKGVSEAIFEYLVFCDDDNWLDEDYIQNTFELFKLNPDAGVLGGLGTAHFERPESKPLWFDNFYHGYAVGPQAAEECILNSVYGAGMAVRTAVLKDALYKYSLFLHGRKRNHLSAGEDSEIYLRVRLSGYKVLYSPRLKFKHFLTSKRLTWDYLKRLHIGFAKTHVVLNLYEQALTREGKRLPFFYWLKRALYYGGIYLKYLPRHYSAYKNGEGMVEEIHHITWKNIALSYLKYNFETITIYHKIVGLKKSIDQAALK
jgi:glycosyltransferase involved in cell wall biosynthesis